jgi:hypothetical protein
MQPEIRERMGFKRASLGCGVRSKHPVSENWDYRA